MTRHFQIDGGRLRLAAIYLAAIAGMTGVLLQSSFVAAEDAAPSSENGRYTLAQTPDGILRLDTRLGTVSTCNNAGGSWICRVVPDERSALDAEIGKLQAENGKLKEQLAQRDATVTGKIDAPLSKQDALKSKPETGKIEIPLPVDHAKLMALIDRVWHQLLAMADTVQKKLSEKI